MPDEVPRMDTFLDGGASMVTFNIDTGPDIVVLMKIDTFDGLVLFTTREPFNVVKFNNIEVNPTGTVGVVRLPVRSDEPVVLILGDGVVKLLVMIGPLELLDRGVVLGIHDAFDRVVLISTMFVVFCNDEEFEVLPIGG